MCVKLRIERANECTEDEVIIRCSGINCGMGLMNTHNTAGYAYFRCRKRADSKSCEGCGTLRVREFEESVYGVMLY